MQRGVGELGQQTGEVGAFGIREGCQGRRDRIASLIAKAADEGLALLGENDPRSAGIVGVGLAANEPELDPLLHEARCARLIDADRFAELAHSERMVAGCQHFKHTHPRRTRDAGIAAMFFRAHRSHPRAPAGARTEAGAASVMTAPTMAVRVVGPVVLRVVRPWRHPRQVAAPSSQANECRRDLIDGVGRRDRHPSNLHAS